ncbi:hypothetical protein E4P36_13700 [Streptomyces sp. 4R-3d]|nr:hypothetical protein E4P36_13700 [Streptomyces sp. 4R-3d]
MWGRGGAPRGLVPLPAPSRNRGSAPDPAPQTPEGLKTSNPIRGCECPRRPEPCPVARAG